MGYWLLLLSIVFNLYIIVDYDFKVTPFSQNTSYDLSFENFSLFQMSSEKIEATLQSQKGILKDRVFELRKTLITQINREQVLAYTKAGLMRVSMEDGTITLNDEVKYQTENILIKSEKVTYNHHQKVLKGYDFNSTIDESYLSGDYFEYNIDKELFKAQKVKLLLEEKWLLQ